MSNVLVVDDDLLVREALAALLECAGHVVLTAPEGAAALAILQEGAAAVDVVVLDLQMPGMDGAAFLAARRQDPALRAIPVVVCSALRVVPRADAYAVLSKTADPRSLLATVRAAIASARPGAAAAGDQSSLP